jgi:hypothetical protein
MKVSDKIIGQLGALIAGDTQVAPYLSGPELVDFFNEFGFKDIYGQGFPTRWKYAAEKIDLLNGSKKLRLMLEEFVDPRLYGGDDRLVKRIVEAINSLIKYDGFALKQIGHVYKVTDTEGNLIQASATKALGHEFVTEQIRKCEQKIADADYPGAITNARTLVKAILLHIVELIEGTEIKNDGNLPSLWNRAKKALKIDISKDDLPEFVFQILSGLDTSLNGLAGLSNNAGDRYANKFKTKRHHEKLAVNLAMTISDFLIDILGNQIQDKQTQSKN